MAMHPAASRQSSPISLLPAMDEPTRKGFILFAQNLGVKFGGSRNACKLYRTFYEDTIDQWNELVVKERDAWIYRAQAIPTEALQLPEPPRRGRVQKLYDLQFSYSHPPVPVTKHSTSYNYRFPTTKNGDPIPPSVHLRLPTKQSVPTSFPPRIFLGRGFPGHKCDDYPVSTHTEGQRLKNAFKPRSRSELLRRQEQRRMDFRPITTIDEEECEDHEIGTPATNLQDAISRELDEKYETDLQKTYETIMEQTGGCIDKIRNLRFLVASVQTFGNIDGMCIPAEFAMNEMNLLDGVIDHFCTEVGPWDVNKGLQARRALSASMETHRISLHVQNCRFTKRELCSQILGRCEPEIARKQGICVGLYTDESEDFESRLNRLYLGDRDPYHILDSNNRRFIVVLRQEYHFIMSSLEYLQNDISLDYDGFPVSPDRFVLADALVDALAKCVGDAALPDCGRWLAALGERLPFGYLTPWERKGELFCPRHRDERNIYCAAVTCSRACFIMMHSLDHLYALI